MSGLEVGSAKRDITPKIPRQTLYHARGMAMDESVPIRDRLWVRATAFRCGDAAALWATADVLCVDSALRAQVLDRLADTGVPADNVVLSATHTHTAASVVDFHGREPTPPAYKAWLADRFADACREALERAAPAMLRTGQARVDFSVNRREAGRMMQVNDIAAPTGLVDDVARVACLTGDAGRSLLVNYAAHSLTMIERVPQISSDFPGRMAQRLEAEPGVCFAQFLQGCTGNINVKIHGDEAEANRVGHGLAEAALACLGSAPEQEVTDLRMAARRVRLPWADIPTETEARETLDAVRAEGEPSGYPAQRKRDWAEQVYREVLKGQPQPYAEVLVQAMRLGDTVFVALPGEVFVEIGAGVRAGVDAPNVFVVAYANNCEVGYIPTAAAFGQGGYEVDTAPYYYGLFRFAPGCGETLAQAAIDTAAQVSSPR